MSELIDLSIIIPAYNEEKRIVPTLNKLVEYTQKKRGANEIMVVDDGSTDSTVSLVRQFAEKNPSVKLLLNGKNEGKGKTVQKGILAAQGNRIYFTDADLSTPVDEIDKFLKEMENADIVIGSRSIQGANVIVHEPFYRDFLGKLFNKIVRILCVPGFVDTQCGAKMFTREAAQAIFPLLKISRFAFDVELLYLAKRFNLKVKEIPITWCHSRDTRVRTFQDGFRMLIDLSRIRWLHRNDKI